MLSFITFLFLQTRMMDSQSVDVFKVQKNPDETVQLILRKYQTVSSEFEKLEKNPTTSLCTLISVVMPEYLSFSPMTGKAELMFMTAAFRADLKRFKRTSFGPFQMQPDFILHQLRQSSRFSEDVLFNQARLTGYEWMADHLEEFARMDVQLRILLIFEENFRRSYPNGSFEEMASLYNTGSVKPSPLIFTKLQYADRSYLGWVRYIRGVVNC